MTDKEIIIDGVDVSECYGYVHNAKGYDCGETYSKFHYRYCEENPNCYYKQLKLKEQECEELKEKVKELRQGWINCDKEHNLQEANSEFRQRVINRYKQTLTEIKEIINDFTKQDILTFPDLKPRENYKLIQKQCGEPIIQILIKINEVLKNE